MTSSHSRLLSSFDTSPHHDSQTFLSSYFPYNIHDKLHFGEPVYDFDSIPGVWRLGRSGLLFNTFGVLITQYHTTTLVSLLFYTGGFSCFDVFGARLLIFPSCRCILFLACFDLLGYHHLSVLLISYGVHISIYFTSSFYPPVKGQSSRVFLVTSCHISFSRHKKQSKRRTKGRKGSDQNAICTIYFSVSSYWMAVVSSFLGRLSISRLFEYFICCVLIRREWELSHECERACNLPDRGCMGGNELRGIRKIANRRAETDILNESE